MPDLSITMFGELRLERNGQPLPPFPTHKVRALFAYLVTFRQRPHSRAVLAGLLWPDVPEERARRNLSDALWRLRHIVGQDFILADEDTLAFNTEGDYELDVEAFQTATTPLNSPTEMSEAEAEQLQRAVALYRGDLLEDFYDDWALLERERLRLRLLEALERLLAWHRDRAAYKAALECALLLVAHDPLRETAHRQAMLLYDRLGQRHAALRQFEICQQILQDELGLAPLPETTLLAEEIRANMAGSRTPFDHFGQVAMVGRQAERAALLARLDETCAGHGGVVLVEGEAGIGKTRLAENVAESANWRGMQVLRGVCRDAPYAPLVEAFQQTLTPLRIAQLTRLMSAAHLSILSTLFPALKPSDALPLPDLAPDKKPLQQALAEMILAFGRIAPCLLIVEDWQWMDAATVEVLQELGSRIAAARVLLLGTARDEELRHRPEVWEQVLSLDRRGVLEHVALKRLAPAETEQLIRQVLGDSSLPAGLSQSTHDSTQGIPLFTIEWLKGLVEAKQLERDAEGKWAFVTGRPLLPPAAIQRVIITRLERLSDAERRLLDAASVLSEPFEFDLWCQMSGLEGEEMLADSDELLRRQLIAETAEGYRFGHDLIRQLTYETMSDADRQHWHRQAGLAIEVLRPADVQALAEHFDRAGDVERALRYHLQAGERAQSLYANQAALRHFERVIALAALSPNAAATEMAVQARLQRAVLYTAQVDYAAAEADYQAALAALNQAEAPPALRAAALHGLGWLRGYYLGRYDEGLAILEQATDAYRQAGDTASVIQVTARRGHLLTESCRWEQALPLQRQALALAVETGDRHNQARALMGIAISNLFLRRPLDALAGLQAALELFRALGDRWSEAKCLANIGQVQLRVPDFSGALEALRRAWEINEQIGMKVDQTFILIGLVYAAYAAGDLEEARRVAQDGLARLEGLEGMASVEAAMTLHHLAKVHRETGALQAALDTFDKELEIALTHHPPTAVDGLGSLAQLHGDLGNFPEAEALAQRAVKLGQEVSFQFGEIKAWQCLARIALARGDVAAARRALERSAALLRGGQGGLEAIVDRLMAGEVWLAAGRPARALALARRVERQAHGCGALLVEVDALCLLGRGWLAQGRADRALPLLRQALAMAQAHGLPWAIAGVATALAQADPPHAREHLEQAWSAVQRMADSLDDLALRRVYLSSAAVRAIADALAAQPLRRRVLLPRAGAPGERVAVLWTLDAGPADAALAARAGKTALRRARILRLLEEAQAQGAAPTQADLAEALGVSTRTIRSDIAALHRGADTNYTNCTN